ncbi:hypothetical protein NPIL_67511 [Nephila pilipes]|uniref:Uncharacterized protein n=1 Tax=Nephila pilipes TaxID=299642 RepID=A0A8X6UUR6_NEPPI|nr:hypothetical protein NPIL_67511 [Nephila pilipes]
MLVILGGMRPSQISTAFEFVLRVVCETFRALPSSSFSEGSGSSKLRRLSISRCGRLCEAFRPFDTRSFRMSPTLPNFGCFRSPVWGRFGKTVRDCGGRCSRNCLFLISYEFGLDPLSV